MQQATKVKLNLYRHQDLARCAPLARYIFPGLKILAGSGRRLRYDLAAIQAELLPYEKIDLRALEALIDELVVAGAICKEKEGQREYLVIQSIGPNGFAKDHDE
ncbi:hypothetical protein GJ698_15010 [Pseudoduganella sp. FT26W]|uniref:ArsR family transcriptional regulator n=1 Tax=Duganella aquatilis TaxID=2666082 RepID=A0A844DD39_9BURK|nr:hypothetical protein [Duganella aquatilis]MRW85394.1 hypothetical protein [Duganella aquatilis]